MTHALSQSAIGEWPQLGAVVETAKSHDPAQPDASPVAMLPTKPAPAERLSKPALDDVVAYQRDLWERTVLFWDTLRQRADNMIAHERAGKPPLLDFDYELILDARRSSGRSTMRCCASRATATSASRTASIQQSRRS